VRRGGARELLEEERVPVAEPNDALDDAVARVAPEHRPREGACGGAVQRRQVEDPRRARKGRHRVTDRRSREGEDEQTRAAPEDVLEEAQRRGVDPLEIVDDEEQLAGDRSQHRTERVAQAVAHERRLDARGAHALVVCERRAPSRQLRDERREALVGPTATRTRTLDGAHDPRRRPERRSRPEGIGRHDHDGQPRCAGGLRSGKLRREP